MLICILARLMFLSALSTILCIYFKLIFVHHVHAGLYLPIITLVQHTCVNIHICTSIVVICSCYTIFTTNQSMITYVKNYSNPWLSMYTSTYQLYKILLSTLQCTVLSLTYHSLKFHVHIYMLTLVYTLCCCASGQNL